MKKDYLQKELLASNFCIINYGALTLGRQVTALITPNHFLDKNCTSQSNLPESRQQIKCTERTLKILPHYQAPFRSTVVSAPPLNRCLHATVQSGLKQELCVLKTGFKWENTHKAGLYHSFGFGFHDAPSRLGTLVQHGKRASKKTH